MQDLLTKKKIRFSKGLFTVTPRYSPEDMFKKLLVQVGSWYADAKDKPSGKGPGIIDDMGVAFHMFVYWTDIVIGALTNPRKRRRR